MNHTGKPKYTTKSNKRNSTKSIPRNMVNNQYENEPQEEIYQLQHFQNLLDATKLEYEKEKQNYLSKNSQLAKHLSTVMMKVSDMEKKLSEIIQENILLRSKNSIEELKHKHNLEEHLRLLEVGFSYKIGEILHMFNKVREREGLELKKYGNILFNTSTSNFEENDENFSESNLSDNINNNNKILNGRKSILKHNTYTNANKTDEIPLNDDNIKKRVIAFENTCVTENKSNKCETNASLRDVEPNQDNAENSRTNALENPDFEDGKEEEEQKKRKRRSSRRESLFSAEEFGFGLGETDTEKENISPHTDLSLIASQDMEMQDNIYNEHEAEEEVEYMQNEYSQEPLINSTSFSLMDVVIPEDGTPEDMENSQPLVISTVPIRRLSQEVNSQLSNYSDSSTSSQESRKIEVFNDEEHSSHSQQSNNKDNKPTKILHSMKSRSKNKSKNDDIMPSMGINSQDSATSISLNKTGNLAPERTRRTRNKSVDYKLPSLRAKMRRPTEAMVDATTFTDIHELQVTKSRKSKTKSISATLSDSNDIRAKEENIKISAATSLYKIKFTQKTNLLLERNVFKQKNREKLCQLSQQLLINKKNVKNDFIGKTFVSKKPSNSASNNSQVKGIKKMPLADITQNSNISNNSVFVPIKPNSSRFNPAVSGKSTVSIKTKRLLSKPVVNILDGLDNDDENSCQPSITTNKGKNHLEINRLRINEDDLSVFDFLDNLEIKTKPKTHKKYTSSSKKLFIR